jgi:sugar phosphate isomerase/epimerase
MNGPMQLLCSTGTFSRYSDHTGYQAILTYGPELEVDGFELMFYPDWTSEIEQIAAGLARSGLHFPAIHAEKGIGPALVSSRAQVREQGRQWMTASCRLGSLVGAKLLIFHLWGLPDSDELFEQNLQMLEGCLSLTDQFGLELAIETIPCTRADPLSNVRRAIEQDARCAVALDTEFLALHNQLEEALKTDWLWQNNLVRHVHIKDYDGGAYSPDNYRRYLHPGEGCIDFTQFCAVLKQRRFSGYISLEASVVNRDGTRDMQRLKKSLTFLRRLMLDA